MGSTQVFINLGENPQLDNRGKNFAPFAEVVEGMEIVRALYRDYGEGPPRGKGPEQTRLHLEGNNYLEVHFTLLSYIENTSMSGVDETWKHAADYEDDDEDFVRVARPILIVLPFIVVAFAAFVCIMCRLRRAYVLSEAEARQIQMAPAKRSLPKLPSRMSPKAQQIPPRPLE